MKGSEAMPTSGGLQESSRSVSEQEVAQRIGELRNALKEALEAFPKVNVGFEEVDPHGPHEVALARAQRLLEGLRGLVEQQRAQNKYREERVTAHFESAVSHLSQFLAIRADLVNAAERHGDPHHLIDEFDAITNTLLSLQPAANEASSHAAGLDNAA